MHLNVEKEVRQGLFMMKYANNHWDDFNNVHVAFIISFLLCAISIAIEFTVILVLTSIKDEIEVILKYVPLSAIAYMPKFYYNSLVEHKLLLVNKIELPFKNFRRDDIPRNCVGKIYRCI